MKNSIYIFCIFTLFGCSDKEPIKLEGNWTGILICEIEEIIPYDSTKSDSSSPTLEQQLGIIKNYEHIVHDSIVFTVKKDSIFTNAETGEFLEYLILDSKQDNELSLFNLNSIIGFNIIRTTNDSLIIEPSIKPFSLGNRHSTIKKAEYRLRKN